MGCKNNKTSYIYDFSKYDQELLNKDCREIEAQENIFELIKGINSSTEKILSYAGDSNPDRHMPKIDILAKKIQGNAVEVKALIKDNLSKTKHTLRAKWDFDESDFRSQIDEGEFEIQEVKVAGVIFSGSNRPDLISKVRVITELESPKSSHVFLKMRVSSLDLCSLLGQTAVIVDTRVLIGYQTIYKTFILSIEKTLVE